jgi:hypothetical protein
MPIQPPAAKGVRGSIVLREEFSEGLRDIEGFFHLILIYHLHLVRDFALSVTPFLDNDEHGIFATRAPKRPNPIGLSLVQLISCKGSRLEIENVNLLDGTRSLTSSHTSPNSMPRKRCASAGSKDANIWTRRGPTIGSVDVRRSRLDHLERTAGTSASDASHRYDAQHRHGNRAQQMA